MRDRHSGTPRGFGFVTYADETAAEEVTQMKHILDGRHVHAAHTALTLLLLSDVDVFQLPASLTWAARPRLQIDAKRSVPQGNLAHKPKSRKIFVGGLAPETTDGTPKPLPGK